MNYSKNILSSCFIKYEVNPGSSALKITAVNSIRPKALHLSGSVGVSRDFSGKDTSKNIIESTLHQVLDPISILPLYTPAMAMAPLKKIGQPAVLARGQQS